jgi:hypothetical protein
MTFSPSDIHVPIYKIQRDISNEMSLPSCLVKNFNGRKCQNGLKWIFFFFARGFVYIWAMIFFSNYNMWNSNVWTFIVWAIWKKLAGRQFGATFEIGRVSVAVESFSRQVNSSRRRWISTLSLCIPTGWQRSGFFVCLFCFVFLKRKTEQKIISKRRER